MPFLHSARLRYTLLLPLAVIIALVASPASSLAAGLTVTPITWDLIGLDSNNTSTGPNLFPVGVKVCNTSGGALTGVQTAISFGAGDTDIALDTGAASTDAIGSLADTECTSSYYTVSITRSSTNQSVNRQYSIDATSTEGSDGSTGTRTLYSLPKSKGLISQNRNTTHKISGPGGCNSDYTVCDPAPTSLTVGNTYVYKLYAETSTAYEQLESFITFPGAIFRVENVQAEYQTPTGATFGGPYADACGWTIDGSLANRGSCTGPIVSPWGPDGKAGNKMTLTYTVKVIGSGSATLTSLIYDFSGASFHYNSDYGDTSLDAEITASVRHPLDVTVTGTGQVTSAPAGITCGTINISCVKDYDENEVVTLTATEDGINNFSPGTSVCPGTGWTLASGSGSSETYTCQVTMDDAKSATAVFSGPSYYPLTTAVTGDGGVSSDLGSIDCTNVGGTCGYGYQGGSVVTLTATPGTGSAFDPTQSVCPGDGWTTTPPIYTIPATTYYCTVTMSESRHATAVFAPVLVPVRPLDVTVTAGAGTITSAPAGINCNQDAETACAQSYDENTVVTLTATPASGQRFVSGTCPGTGWTAVGDGTYTCVVTLDGAKSATAAFETIPSPVTTYPLQTTVTGSGSITGPSINCTEAGGSSCDSSYNAGTTVTLTAIPATGYRFDSGTCPGTGWTATGSGLYTCTVTMDAAKNASAKFVKLADPKLELKVKTDKKSIKNGQTVKVTGTLKNIGELGAKDTQVCLDIPSGFVLVSYGKGGKVKGGKVCWKTGDLDPTKSTQVWMKLRAVRSLKKVVVPGAAGASNAKPAKGKATVQVKPAKKPTKPPTG